MDKTLIILLFLSINNWTFSQTNESLLSLYTNLDNFHQIQNQKIFNGLEYREIYRTTNEKHSFLKRKDFYNASLLYDGEYYLDIPIRYDMFRDIVVVKIQTENGQVYRFQLITELLESFKVDQQTFIYKANNTNNLGTGFYEVSLVADCATLLKKRKFKPHEKRDKSYLYYDFEELGTQWVLKFSNRYVNISRREIVNSFPQQKEKINNFYRKNRTLKKSSKEKFYQGLILMLSQSSCK